VDLPHELFRRCTVLLRIEPGGGYVLSHKPVSSPVQPAEEAHFPSAQRTLAIDQDLERPSVHSHSPNSATVLSSTNLKIHDKFKPSAGRPFHARISMPGPHAAESAVHPENLPRDPAVPGIRRPADCRHHIRRFADSLQRMHRDARAKRCSVTRDSLRQRRLHKSGRNTVDPDAIADIGGCRG